MLRRALALLFSLTAVTTFAQAPAPPPPHFDTPFDIASPLTGGRGALIDLVPGGDGFLALVAASDLPPVFWIQRLTAEGLPLSASTLLEPVIGRPRLVATASGPLLFWSRLGVGGAVVEQYTSAIRADTSLVDSSGHKVTQQAIFDPILCGPHACFAVDQFAHSGAILDLSGNPQITGLSLPSTSTRILAADDDGFLLGVPGAGITPPSLIHIDGRGIATWSVVLPLATQRFAADFDGRQFVLARFENGQLSISTISLSGRQGATRTLPASRILPQEAPVMAWNGAQHLIAVTAATIGFTGQSQDDKLRLPSILLALRIDRDLSPLQPDYVSLDSDPVNVGRPSLAVNGSTFLAAWTHFATSDGVSHDVRTAAVTPDGAITRNRGAAPARLDQLDPVIVFNGNRSLVVWREADPAAGHDFVRFAIIAGSATVRSGILATPRGATGLAAGASGSDFLVVWRALVSLPKPDPLLPDTIEEAAIVGENGEFSSFIFSLPAINSDVRSAVTAGDDGWIVVGADGDGFLRIVKVSRDGHHVEPDPVPTVTLSPTYLAAVHTSARPVVVFSARSNKDCPTCDAPWVLTLSGDGSAKSIEQVGGVAGPVAAAWNGSEILMVSSLGSRTSLTRLNADGQPLAATVSESSTPGVSPEYGQLSVAPFAPGWLISWGTGLQRADAEGHLVSIPSGNTFFGLTGLVPGRVAGILGHQQTYPDSPFARIFSYIEIFELTQTRRRNAQ
jgi:hypothetical protein